MTPAQLDHLRRIGAHLANLLSLAEKRTAGRWTIKTQQRELGQSGEFETEAWIAPDDASKCVTNGWNLEDEDGDNFAFIASCAGNAEAGWKATRAVIAHLFIFADAGIPMSEPTQALVATILAAFPLEMLDATK